MTAQGDGERVGGCALLADLIIDGIRPATVLDARCGRGQLVAALRHRGVDAHGIDGFDQAIQMAEPGVRPYCQKGSATERLSQRYDLIICIGGLEGLEPGEAEQALGHLCLQTDDILFSPESTGGDRSDPGERSFAFWAELFARHGFYRDLEFDASPFGPRASRQRRARDPALAYAAYEEHLRALAQEAQALRQLNTTQWQELQVQQDAILALNARVQHAEARWAILENSMGWQLLQGLQHMRARLAPPGSKRDELLDMAYRTVRSRQRMAYAQFARAVLRGAKRLGRRLVWRLHLPGSASFREHCRQVAAVEMRAESLTHRSTVDIIVCVHNALVDVRRCLESVVRHTSRPYELVLVDDGSNQETSQYVKGFAQDHGAVLLVNKEARGYTRAANQGLERSTADYMLLLNSDTVVTPNWLDRMVACAESDPHIGMVGPLSNTASWQSIPEVAVMGDWAANPLPVGMTVDDMAALVARYSARLYPVLPFLNGFCLLIRRQVLDQIGLFDEEGFGAGYGEENDYALRAQNSGWRLAVADDAYVFHAQSKSYSNEARARLSEQAGRNLIRKHGLGVVEKGVALCQNDRVLAGIRSRSQAALSRQAYLRQGRERYAGRSLLFALPIAAPGGGGNVVIDEAQAMRDMGVEVRIFNLARYRERFERAYPGLQIPVIYGDLESFLTAASEHDAVIATFNTMVEWLARLGPRSGRPVRGYYVQDFEPCMYAPGTPEFGRALQSYTLVPDTVRFTKTEWTRQEVKRQTGADCAVIGASVNTDLFRPRPRTGAQWPQGPLRIAAMVRPESLYRQPRLTMDLLREAARQYGNEVEISIFGATLDDPNFLAFPRDFAWRLGGILSQKQVANLLNEADIFADFSSHQAMGLTALEAMACGAAVIVPKLGGATVFARHEQNSLVVDTLSREAAWQALRRLIEEDALRSRLQSAALESVCHFYPERPAFNILSTLFDRQG